MPHGPEASLLAGLRVVEFEGRIATSACGQLLAGLGAEVTLVPLPTKQIIAEAQRLHVDKRPLLSPDAEYPLAGADIVLLSTDMPGPGTAFWLDPVSAGQIVCDLSVFGHGGPLAGTTMSEAMLQAISGLAATTGLADGPPVTIGSPLIEMEAAAYAAAAILAALRYRDRTGLGQRVEIALYDVAVNALLTFIPLELVGRHATRSGNRHPTLATWNSYHAQDGWVLICAPTNDQWTRLCSVIGRPELSNDPAYRTPPQRLDSIQTIDALLGEWAGRQQVATAVAALLDQGIASGPIVSLADLPAERNLIQRESLRRASINGHEIDVPRSPIRVSQVHAKAAPEPGQTSPGAGQADALAGVRVIEIGMNTVAPLACRQMGAMGADIIKIEPPAGDSNRHNAPLRADGQSHLFALSNTDKRGLVLDLRDPADKEKLLALLKTTDVLIENLKPGSLDRLGLGSVALGALFPRLIYCSVNGFGHDTAYPGRPALDTVIQGMSGVMSATVYQGMPLKSGISVSDQLGGQFGLAAILAALHRREKTGQGCSIDIAMQDCSAWATQLQWNGGAPLESKMIRVADGWVSVSADPGLDLAGASRLEAVETLASRGIQAAPVLEVAEVMRAPQCEARGLLKTVSAPDGSTWRVLESPLRLHTTPARVRSAMGRLGLMDAQLETELGAIRNSSPRREPIRAAGELKT